MELEHGQIILHTDGGICSSKKELLWSGVFHRILGLYIQDLIARNPSLTEVIGLDLSGMAEDGFLLDLLRSLGEATIERVAEVIPEARRFLEPGPRTALHELVEGFYDFWRSFDRFMVLHSEPGPSGFDQRPYRSFNATIEALTHLVRSTYRDICENITGSHPRIYRQVAAGCDIGLIAIPTTANLPKAYQESAGQIPFIRQVWIAPPLIIDPPMNTRTGQFQKIRENPIAGVRLKPCEWLCYPARVGPLLIFIYFHQRFMGLGCAMANLFDLASDEQIAEQPDAVYFFGAPSGDLARFGSLPTVFYDDEENGILAAAVPGEDRFGYFGYLKKMALTLHNIVMMKRGRMPYHGAMVRILLKSGKTASVLLIGDTAAGKSESLEAFRLLGKERIRETRIIADDMGSISIDPDGRLLGYGTETGAFIRLDDLQQGYAFSQIDRAIIMSPHKVNARVVLPVTTIDEVLRGYGIDYLLYANNYEEVDAGHPILERLDSLPRALAVFREGTAMAKGTTSSKGLVRSYFANIFGPPQYMAIHDALAENTFKAALVSGVWIGQLRTRLGIGGYEKKGPENAAIALLDLMENGGCGASIDSQNIRREEVILNECRL
jgi:hypothetical protein